MKATFNIKQSTFNKSINGGIRYLLSHMHSGRWRGFPTLAGASDTWVTGFVMAHIQPICKNQVAFKDSKDFLLASRQPTYGWSYSATVPSDADSTAWCMIALQQANGLTQDELEKSKSFLWSHFVDPGLSTYRIHSGIGDFISAPNAESIAGWCTSHPDVSIAAVLADINHEKVPEVLDWLQRLSTSEGFVDSYWWRGPFYTTTLMLRALHRRGEALPKELAERLLKGLKRLQLDDGGFAHDKASNLSPFNSALALEAFLYLKDIGGQNEAGACAKALLKAQTANGGWTGNFILRIPAPNVLNPKTVVAYDNPDLGGNSFIHDRDGIFATAMSCYALDCFQRIYNATNNVPF